MAIHEDDQYLQDIPAVQVPMEHSVDPDYGDLRSGQTDVSAPAGQPAGSRWGTPGRYVYRLVVTDPSRGRIDWVIDPYARDFGVGEQSAVLLGGKPFAWSAADDAWRVPPLQDLVMYEINLAESHVDLGGAIERLDYLADLGVNCRSIMPVTNVASRVGWGYLPIGYFGVDERFGGNDKFKTLPAGLFSPASTCMTGSGTARIPSWAPSQRTISPARAPAPITRGSSRRTSSWR